MAETEVKEEVKKEPETPAPEADSREEVMLGDGRTVKLSKDEQRYLVNLGYEAYVKSKETEAAKPDKKEEDKEADVDEGALSKKVDTLLAEVIAIRKENQDKEKAQTTKQIRDQIESEIESCLKGHELTKDDKELADSARDLVINRLVTTRGISVKDAFTREIKHFENIRSRYIKDKKNDKEVTKGAGRGGAPASGDPEKMTGKDFLSGNLRRNVHKKLEDARKKANRF